MSAGRERCPECGCAIIPRPEWYAEKHMRPEWKALGARQGQSRGLCRPCYMRLLRAGELERHPLAAVDLPDTCCVDGCRAPRVARSRCEKHYRRVRKFGTDELPRLTDEERYWAKVAKTDSCWLWTGYLSSQGYGSYKFRGRQRQVHHIAYELMVGPVPAGMHLDHVKERGCEHRSCVNPDHLEPVTPAENNRRSESPSAINIRRTECVAGHPFDEENTLWLGNGKGRACRACRRRRQKGRVRNAA